MGLAFGGAFGSLKVPDDLVSELGKLWRTTVIGAKAVSTRLRKAVNQADLPTRSTLTSFAPPLLKLAHSFAKLSACSFATRAARCGRSRSFQKLCSG